MAGPSAPGTVLHNGSATIGSIVFGTVDSDGCEWILESVEGWDSIGTTSSVDQKVADEGGWPNQAFRPARHPVINATVVANSYAEASVALDRLHAAVPTNSLTTLVVTESGSRSLQALVRADDQMQPSRVEGDVSAIQFSLPLVAPDPRRYSTTLSSAMTLLPSTSGGLVLPITLPITIGATVSSGQLTLTNDGTTRTPLTFTLVGPIPAGSSVLHVGQSRRLTFPYDVPDGRTLVVNAHDATSVMDGAARAVYGLGFDLLPGANLLQFSAPSSAAGSLTVTYRSAWK